MRDVLLTFEFSLFINFLKIFQNLQLRGFVVLNSTSLLDEGDLCCLLFKYQEKRWRCP
jgi:hypothetical protein